MEIGNNLRLKPNPGSAHITPAGVYFPPPYVAKTKKDDVFYRLSAYILDHCILSASQLRPNTYLITASEYPDLVRSGLGAVGLYALPSRTAAIHCWEVKPSVGTHFLVRTVISNFGMAGGGVEAFFPFGFKGGTITKITKNLPEM